MNDYYLWKTAKDNTAQLVAEADRARLARSQGAATSGQRRAERPRRSHRHGLSFGTLLNRIALF